MAKDGVVWEEMNPKVKEAMLVSEMKSREADKRMQLAAKLKKDLDMTNSQVNQLIGALRKDPWKVLANPALGHDVRKLAESYVWDMVNEERMKSKYTPEEWDALQRGKKAEAELSTLKEQQEQAKKEQEDREFEAMKQQRREHWEREIPKAIEEFKLPKTSYTVARFAQYIKALSKAKIPVDMAKVAAVVKDEISGMQPQFLLPERYAAEKPEDYEDRILASVPADFLKMLRRADLRKLRARGLAPKPGPKPGNATPQPSKKMSMTDWLAQRDQRLGLK